jgi:hypothetical protein
MKRFIPFRLSVAIPVVVILAALTWALMGPLAKSVAQKGATAAFGTPVTFSALSVNPWTGTLSFSDLQVADKKNPGQNVLAAKTGVGTLSLVELLRGRAVVDDMTLTTVRMRVERNEDGSFNVEDLGQEQPPATDDQKKQAQLTDWLERAKQVAEKLKDWRAKEKQREEEAKKRKQSGEKPPPPTPEQIKTGKAEYVKRVEPLVVVRRLSVNDLELELSDKTKPGEKLPPLTNASAVLENVSSDPLHHDKAITFKLGGNFADQGRVDTNGTLGLNLYAPALVQFGATTKDLKLALLKPLFGLSLPVTLKNGTTNLDSDVSLTDFSALKVLPDLAINDLAIEPDGTHDKLIGIPAPQFCEAVNRAKTLAIKGLQIGGTFTAPEFTWSEEFKQGMQQMLLDAGKAAVSAEAQKQIDKGKEQLTKEAEKALGSEKGKEATKQAEDILKKAGGMLPGFGK